MFDRIKGILFNMAMIVVIDYKVGNVESVCKAFRHIGCPVVLSRSKQQILAADGLVLPGVAAFGYAMNALGQATGYVKDAVLAGKPLLGICVGYQILFELGMEFGVHRGLGLVKGQVVPIPEGRTIPHMGWNQVQIPPNMELFGGLGPTRYFYFAHSYYADIQDKDAVIAYADYGFALPAAIQKGKIFGTQFHPEKSGNQGLTVLANFWCICKGVCEDVS